MKLFKIKKDKQGRTSIDTLPNQTITYDPATDCYSITTKLEQIHRSTVESSLLDKLYNLAWEGEESHYSFRLDENDLICEKINTQRVEFKIGELFEFTKPVMEIESDVKFLNEIHQTNLITKDLLEAAQNWWDTHNYAENG